MKQKYYRRFFLLLAMLLAVTFANAQIIVEASETVELMAILSRTAGFREYCMDMGGQYTKDTEAWYAPYKQHPAVAYMKDLRSKYNIGYDAVMTMAINLETNGKKVTMTGEKLNLGNRWQNIETDTFLVHLNQFYTDTRFHDFYTQHQSFYESVLRTYEQNVMQYFHQDWYPRFYGTEPTERFRIVIGFTNGGGNYGPSRQLTGQPKEVFYRGMSNQAYRNATTVINESIVRAAVIIYMQENGFSAEQIKSEIYEQIARDFLWMPELVTALRHYAKHRNHYKTLGDYYPEIAKCLEKYLKVETERIENAL